MHDIQIRSYKPPHTRPCQYGLAFHDDSVFADFNVNENGSLYLVRISFDGYGCCYPNAQEKLAEISVDNSKYLIKQMEADDFADPIVSKIIREYFSAIRASLWEDALKDHGII
jgi:hypothetical protein